MVEDYHDELEEEAAAGQVGRGLPIEYRSADSRIYIDGEAITRMTEWRKSWRRSLGKVSLRKMFRVVDQAGSEAVQVTTGYIVDTELVKDILRHACSIPWDDNRGLAMRYHAQIVTAEHDRSTHQS